MSSSYCDSSAESITIFVSFILTSGSCHKLERYQILALDYEPNQYELREDSRPRGVKSFQRKGKDQRKLRILHRNCDVLRYIFPEVISFVSPQVDVSAHVVQKSASCEDISRCRPSGQHIKCLSFSSTRCSHVAL